MMTGERTRKHYNRDNGDGTQTGRRSVGLEGYRYRYDMAEIGRGA